MFLFALDIF